jgi:6,7-dimethyl-8-ribityllumazine synthase
MSTSLPPQPRHTSSRRTFVIVASQYNPVYVKGLIDHARKELETISPNAHLVLHEVPGAFEIPLAAQEVALRGSVDAIIAFGVIIQGETQHADLVARAVTDALQRTALQFHVPVIHEVLLLADEDQARKRCLEAGLNRGTEAARAAVRMVQTISEIKTR